MDESEEPPEPIRNRFTTLAVVSVVWMFAVTPFVTDSGFECTSVVALVTGLPILTIWLSRTFPCRPLSLRPRMKFAAWWVPPFAMVIILSQVTTNWGLIVRVALSSGSLEAAAAQCEPDNFHSNPRMIGLFHVCRVESSSTGAIAFHTTQEFIDTSGVLYMPPGTTAPPGITVREHLYGPWYRFYWRF